MEYGRVRIQDGLGTGGSRAIALAGGDGSRPLFHARLLVVGFFRRLGRHGGDARPEESLGFREFLQRLLRQRERLFLIAERQSLPWNAELAIGVNYRASVETLTNQVSGILDIL